MLTKPKISVCIPVYKGESTIEETIRSVTGQTFKDFEIVITDDSPDDKSSRIIKSIKDKRIRYFLNKNNLGCGSNLNKGTRIASCDLLFYLSQDDLLDKEALEKIYRAFCSDPQIGIVIRPYYWFQKSYKFPVRITRQFTKDKIVSIESSLDSIADIIALSDQVSGVGLRRKYIKSSFSNAPFIEMASAVCDILKRSKACILKDNIVAVRIGNNGATSPRVYINSPVMVWYDLLQKTYSGTNFENLRKYLVDHFIANNYIGLVQIKNYGTLTQLFRELYFMIKLRKNNLYSLPFWFFTLGTIIVPRFLLKRMVNYYKNKVSVNNIDKNIAIKFT